MIGIGAKTISGGGTGSSVDISLESVAETIRMLWTRLKDQNKSNFLTLFKVPDEVKICSKLA
jgi:hypothetical protein